MKGLATEALLAITRGHVPVIVSFFQEGQDKVVEFLSASQAPFRVLTAGNFHQTAPANKEVLLVNAELVGTPEWNAFVSAGMKAFSFHFLFGGHYPLPDRENKILSALTAGHPLKTPVFFCISLEDPLMIAFGSEKLTPLLETLGLKDEECIEHALVTKSIQRAQEKLARTVTHETRTQSEAAWFERNYQKKD